ncbi:putative FBD-associated F-box protein [Trichinella spiralis]|uniref:FBD-associated F-box protein n=1 Tax=Trichinella spiralis TaxID=6334 RepID=A0ABR3K486_TRISP
MENRLLDRLGRGRNGFGSSADRNIVVLVLQVVERATRFLPASLRRRRSKRNYPWASRCFLPLAFDRALVQTSTSGFVSAVWGEVASDIASDFYPPHCKHISRIIHSRLFSVCLWIRSFKLIQLVDLFVAVSFSNSPLQGGVWQKLASKFCLRMLISMPHESSHPPQTVVIRHALFHCARSSARYPLLQLYVIFLPRALVNNEVHIPAPRAVHRSLQRAVHVTWNTSA